MACLPMISPAQKKFSISIIDLDTADFDHYIVLTTSWKHALDKSVVLSDLMRDRLGFPDLWDYIHYSDFRDDLDDWNIVISLLELHDL